MDFAMEAVGGFAAGLLETLLLMWLLRKMKVPMPVCCVVAAGLPQFMAMGPLSLRLYRAVVVGGSGLLVYSVVPIWARQVAKDDRLRVVFALLVSLIFASALAYLPIIAASSSGAAFGSLAVCAVMGLRRPSPPPIEQGPA
jgi:hypothetical protein